MMAKILSRASAKVAYNDEAQARRDLSEASFNSKYHTKPNFAPIPGRGAASACTRLLGGQS
jgi:hypothetical protein